MKKIPFFSVAGIGLISSLIFYSSLAFSESQLEKIHVIEHETSEKNAAFWSEGLFKGGDQSIHQAIIKTIRYSVHRDHERMVIELGSTHNGEMTPLSKAPFYQLFLEPRLNRFTLTFWGNPKLHFDPKKLHEMTRKSTQISRLQLLPKLEDELWSFGLSMKKPFEVKVFELDSPIRIIIDIKTIKGA